VDSVCRVIHLQIIREGLSCVRYGPQERPLEAIGKDFQCIPGHGQTCCDVVQSSVNSSGLGRHLVGETLGVLCIMLQWGPEALCFDWLLTICQQPGTRGIFFR
jgi:hypothetical protein